MSRCMDGTLAEGFERGSRNFGASANPFKTHMSRTYSVYTTLCGRIQDVFRSEIVHHYALTCLLFGTKAENLHWEAVNFEQQHVIGPAKQQLQVDHNE
jgi:hypothetical protein